MNGQLQTPAGFFWEKEQSCALNSRLSGPQGRCDCELKSRFLGYNFFFRGFKIDIPAFDTCKVKVRLFLCMPGRWMGTGDVSPLIADFESIRK